ncbi:MAG: hypothetical protein QME74_06145, partial [Candidatus Edwardsbacteria bacterium]|nr:hypothetical protein [Candidatus Edwardsbacteria bacterium]
IIFAPLSKTEEDVATKTCGEQAESHLHHRFPGLEWPHKSQNIFFKLNLCSLCPFGTAQGKLLWLNRY